jgi:cyclopropane-fatty-acyl-phospholipid synthase
MWYNSLLEKDNVPDFLIRKGIRSLLAQRLVDEGKEDIESQHQVQMDFISQLKNSPIAINTQEANEQHYEVPTEFYKYCLGKHLKYSSGFWEEGETNIDASEEKMLALTCKRADLKSGQNILELGCGWGSLSLYMAAKFPENKVTAVSNSKTQKIYIDAQAKERGLKNLTIITANIVSFDIEEKFDRVVSVEMFEHMRNYTLLLKKVAGWMKPEAKLFVHIFTHKELAYPFEVKDESDWMSKYFFTGGIMPSNNLFYHFQDDLKVQEHWVVSGMHYSKTSEAWLSNMDKNKDAIMPLFEQTYGKDQATKWWVYWRIFYMSCAELWGYNKGNEWIVSHYIFQKNK